MEITKLTALGFYLNGALGSGQYDDVSISAVKQAIDDGTIFDFLEDRLGKDVDLSILYNDDRAELLDEWQRIRNAVDEGRKFAIREGSPGLCLLVAYLLEGIQMSARAASGGV